jgi:hypothetical protein
MVSRVSEFRELVKLQKPPKTLRNWKGFGWFADAS